VKTSLEIKNQNSLQLFGSISRYFWSPVVDLPRNVWCSVGHGTFAYHRLSTSGKGNLFAGYPWASDLTFSLARWARDQASHLPTKSLKEQTKTCPGQAKFESPEAFSFVG